MIIVNSNLPADIFSALNELPYKVKCAPVSSKLPRELSAHPDMLIHASPEGFVCPPEIHDALSIDGIPSLCGCAEPSAVYPDDILYNCFCINGALICNEKHTDLVILDIYRRRGSPVFHTNQGYASCSTLRIGSAAITADTSIADACEKAGARVLCISPGGIRLDGYSYGFIGGCGGCVDGKLLLFGDPLTHPDGKHIVSFTESLGVEVVSLCGGMLTDYGGIIPCSDAF